MVTDVALHIQSGSYLKIRQGLLWYRDFDCVSLTPLVESNTPVSQVHLRVMVGPPAGLNRSHEDRSDEYLGDVVGLQSLQIDESI